MTLWIIVALVVVIVIITTCRLLARVIRDINRYDPPPRTRRDRRTDHP
jgi:hypothetical protein